MVDELESPRVVELAKSGAELVVWWETCVECASVLARREREQELTNSAADAARELLAALRGAWVEVVASHEVHDHAERLLRCHPLRVADAL